jgi:uncharacterized iron-regulated membrane protein
VESGSRRSLFRIHAWIGLQLGYLLYAVCLTGTLAVLSRELLWLADPQLRAQSQLQEAGAAPFSWQRLYEAVASAHPQATILYLHAPDGARSVALATIAYGLQDHRGVPVDVTQDYAVRDHRSGFGLQSFLRILHKQFYLVPGIVGFHGTLIVGALALPLLLAVYTGLVSVKRWWRAMRQIRRGRSVRVFWSDLHRFAGLWAAAVAILLALTGLWFFAETVLERSGLLAEDGPRFHFSTAVLRSRPALLPPPDLDRAAAAASAAWPGLTLTRLELPVRGDDALIFTGQAEAWLVRDRANRILVDPFTHAVVQVQRGEMLSIGRRWIETADPLHFGNFAGLGSKLVWFAAGLLLSGGILAGLVSAWLRLARHPDAAMPRTALASAICTLLLLGAAAHGAWAYGYSFQRLAQRPHDLLALGEATLGPWQMRVQAVGGERVEIRPAESGQPNLRSATLNGEAMRRAAEKFWAPWPAGCAAGCRLRLQAEGWNGQRHAADLEIAPAQASRQPLPVAAGMGAGEQAILALLLLALLLPLGFWLRLLWLAGTKKPGG